MLNQNELPVREFRLELFGGPTLYRGDSVVRLSPQESLLVGLLGAFGREGALRSIFYDYFWNDGDTSALKPRFGQLLHMVRLKLHSHNAVLQIDGRLLLNRQVIAVDLEEWDEAVARNDFEKAWHQLARGFFAHQRGKASHTLGDWISRSQMDCRRKLQLAIGNRISAAEACVDFVRIADLASLQLQIDPQDEDALRRSMRAHAILQELPNVEAAFRTFSVRQKTLNPEWEPANQTIALLENLKNVRVNEVSPNRRIVGRAEELRFLAGMVRENDPPHPKVVLVQAPPGVGKSSLLNAVLPSWGLDGHPTLRAHCSAYSPQDSYGVLHQFLADAPRTLEGPCLRPLSPASPLAHAFRWLSELLDALSSPQHPTVLVVDDIELADQASLRVLEWTIRQTSDRGWVLVCTAAADARARDRLWPLLKADPNYHCLRLDSLSSTSAQELVNLLLPDQDPLLVSRILRLSGGNPHLIGLLCKMDGPEQQREGAISQHLSDYLMSCLRGSPRWTLQILAALAVTSVSWSLELLSRCLTVSTGAVQVAIRYLQDSGVIRAAGKNLHIVIGAYGEVARTTQALDLPITRNRIAEFLSREGYPAEILVEAWDGAASSQKVMEQAILAADAAGRRGDVLSRVDFLRCGLVHSQGSDRGFEFQVLLGTALLMARAVQEAIPILEKACQEAFVLGSREVWLQLQIHLLDARGHLDGVEPEATVARLEEIMETCTHANALLESAHALDRILHYHHRAGDEAGVAEAFDRAETLLHLTDVPEVRARTHATLAMRTYYGDPLGGLTHAREAVRASEESPSPGLRLHTLNRLLAVLLATGRLRCPSEKAVVTEALELAGSEGDLLQRSHVLINLAVWEADCRNWEAASEKFRQLIPHVRAAQDRRPLVLALCNLGLVLVRSGQFSAAAEVLEEGRGLLQHWDSQEVRAQFHAGLGWVALEGGRIGLAGKYFEHLMGIDLPKSADLTTITLFKCHYLRRNGRIQSALDLLDSTIRQTQPRFPLHAIALISARARFGARRSNPARWESDREWAIGQARQLSLSEWAIALRGSSP
jgi:tetratricopeptide (TPR) repeat protein